MAWDVDRFSEDEELLTSRSLAEILRRAAAIRSVEADEIAAAESTRPTMPVFPGEPWR
jgi:hypothetical protein